MNIAVFGLGYVGCVSAACLANLGHHVIGVDVNPVKVDLINQGKSPIIEKDLDKIIVKVVGRGHLTATQDVAHAIAQSDISLICVGTPSQENGSLDLRYIQNVSCEIGRALRDQDKYHLVVVRSTMLPGSVEAAVIACVEQASGKRIGEAFDVCINPEFLREGSAVEDYHHPALTLIGGANQKSSDLAARIYEAIDAPLIQTDIRTAEMIKYVNNAFHALKVSFGNEVGLMCKAMDIDSHKVMDIVTQDTQLNISPKYLRPGFAFGGSCLPKDMRALTHQAKMLDLDLPVLNAILPSNAQHIEQAFRMVQRSGRKKIGMLGLSFKPGTDDLRESPLVRLAERLIGKGYALKIYDENVSMAKVMGGNRQYIEQTIPHISTLLVSDIDQLMDHAEIVIIGNNVPQSQAVLDRCRDDQQIIDLARTDTDISNLNGNYQGICW